MKRFYISTLGLSFIFLAFVFTSSCTKETVTNTVHDSTTIINHDTVTNTIWTMTYFEGTAGNYMYYAPQSFIKSGTAKMASNLFHQGYWFSDFTLPIPKEINLNLDNDSLKLVANIRNVNGDGRANEIDLGLNYTTTTYFSASWQKGTDAQFCKLGLSGQSINNVTEQLTDPSTYAEYALSIQGNQVTSYKNNTALKTVSYTGTTGRAAIIDIAFRGYGEIDWVKLYKGSKLIMIENFNTDGQTTAIWSKP